MSELKATGLHRAIRGRPVLTDVDIVLRPGSITALLGPSGGGKSTLLRALALLEPPDRGTIVVDGVTYTHPSRTNPPAPWPRVSLVFQQLFLWPHLTIRQNLALGLDGQHGDRIERYATLFAMEEFVDRYPNEVSGGQRQRGALARALVLKPRYLLLDEVTSALDVEHVAALLLHLQSLRDTGTSILLATHLVGFARQAADQVVFMDGGRIVERGGSEVLLAPGTERFARFLALVRAAT